MRRISVVGSSGSGKTSFATAIAGRLQLPHLELDSVYHQPNWAPLPHDEFRRRVADYVLRPSWIIDGNYASQGVLDIVWRHADTVIWLDLPRRVVFSRVVLRSLERMITRAELWNGNRVRALNLVRLDPHQNIVLWSITRFAHVRARYGARMRDPAWSHLAFHRLRSRAEQRAFLRASDQAVSRPAL
jgi:adenylate kinase family enzyme